MTRMTRGPIGDSWQPSMPSSPNVFGPRCTMSAMRTRVERQAMWLPGHCDMPGRCSSGPRAGCTSQLQNLVFFEPRMFFFLPRPRSMANAICAPCTVKQRCAGSRVAIFARRLRTAAAPRSATRRPPPRSASHAPAAPPQRPRAKQHDEAKRRLRSIRYIHDDDANDGDAPHGGAW